MLKERVLNHFYIGYNRKKVADGIKQAYIQGADDCMEYLSEKAWHIITEDTDSYPKCHQEVLIEDDRGDNNVAYCDANCDWYISNGENTLKLIGEVAKWIELE